MSVVTRAAHVLLVEDDPVLRDRILAPGLASYGFRVTSVGSAAAMHASWVVDSPDIVILDIGLPDGNGFDLAGKLQGTAVGIVMLTGRTDVADKIRGLTNGADAYFAKPVLLPELAATLHSLLRRLQPAVPVTSAASAEASWRLDAQDWCLLTPEGQSVALNHTERTLLRALLNAAGEPMGRDELIAALGGDGLFDPHRLEMLVYRLRSKIASATGATLPLRAVRGAGYVFLPG